MSESVRVALIQLEVSDEEPVGERIERAAGLVRAEVGRSELVLLPELWHLGAFATARAVDHAEPRDGSVVTAMRAAARAAGLWLHAGSFVELDGDRCYNTSVLIDPDGEPVAWYRKQYLFGFASGEASVMSAGDDLVVLDTPVGRSGIATCYDLRFPELFRGLVDAGAQTFLVASGWPTARMEHWRVLTRARAIENQAWLLACNTSGVHADTPMGGGSLVIDPLGEVVAQAGEGEQVLRALVDPAAASAWRDRFPALADRRTAPRTQ